MAGCGDSDTQSRKKLGRRLIEKVGISRAFLKEDGFVDMGGGNSRSDGGYYFIVF